MVSNWRDHEDWIVLLVPPVVFVLLLLYGSDYVTSVAVTVATYAVLGLGLNVVIGFAGLLDLGYAAFFAIGAYATAIFATKFGWNVWETLPAAVIAAGLSGAILGYPTLRLRSDYLAIVTLGFGEIVRLSFNNWDYVNGPDGIYGIPIPSIFGQQLDTQDWYMALVTLLLVLVIFITSNMSNSRLARGWIALRQDELAAEVSGVPTLKLKMWAYVVGGMIGGLAGSIFAIRIGLVNPSSFTLSVTITVLMLLVLGGSGSLGGILLGAAVVVGLPEVLRDVQQFRLLAFSVALIAIMILRPQGLWPRKIHHPNLDSVASTDATDVVPRRAGAGAGEALLSIRGLSRSFGGVQAVRDVSFDIWPREVVSIIGPNGAGKTTLFNCVSRIQRSDAGKIYFAGHLLSRQQPHSVTALGMARTFQSIRLFPQMSVLENVMIGLSTQQRTRILGTMLHLRKERREERQSVAQALHWLRFVGADAMARRQASELSYAHQRRVEIARALASDPLLLLLDEPAAGTNPTEKAELVHLIQRIRDENVAVVLIEHDMPVVMTVSDRVIALDLGKVIATGTPSQVQQNPAVISAYLGTEDSAEGDDASETGLEL